MGSMDHSKRHFNGVIEYDHSIKKYNSWRVGGNVKCCYWPADLDDMIRFIRHLPTSENIILLGLGSNVLFQDKTLDATVIMTTKSLNKYKRLGDGVYSFEAGVSCAKAAKVLARDGIDSGAFFAGIPGTIGGALRMNAGAFGGETWRHVAFVDFLHRDGEVERIDATDFEIGYREVSLPSLGWFLSANFTFPTSKKSEDTLSISELLKKRSESQPIGSFNCGSVFKNPRGGYAAEYIESCGLKGRRIGGAVISPKHANFIINEDNASADDIINLINLIKTEVLQKHNVMLETEVKIYLSGGLNDS